MAEEQTTGLVREEGVARCWWCTGHEDYRRYHDEEWGRPQGDDRRLFEKLSLEAFQSGLSWLTILRRREGFRRAFRDFDFEAVARFNTKSVERLLKDEGIIRHRGKIEATIANARLAADLVDEFGSLAAYLWRFETPAEERPARVTRAALMKLTESAGSRALSRDLRRRGWRFVGPTTCYAFMQSMGLVNDHLEGCHVRSEVERERRAFLRPK